ncbi:hypothetical protein ACWGI9_32325 [Streptomyces sp. NPDC054833]
MSVRISRGPPRTEGWYGTAHMPDALSGGRMERHERSLRRDVLR